MARAMLLAGGLLVATLFPGDGVSQASNVRAGAGIYGVYGFPVVQEDVAAGALYGAKARADLLGALGAEVSYTSFPGTDVDFDTQLGKMSTEGWGHSVLALDLIVQSTGETGFGVYVAGGLGSYSLTKKHADDLTRMGYNAGLGIEFRSLMGISIDISGRLHAMSMEDGGTHKFAAVQAGVNYYFLR